MDDSADECDQARLTPSRAWETLFRSKGNNHIWKKFPRMVFPFPQSRSRAITMGQGRAGHFERSEKSPAGGVGEEIPPHGFMDR